MTTTQTPVPTDLLASFASVLDSAETVVAGIAPDQLHLPTPCDEFDVLQLVGHLMGAVRRIGDLAHGEFVDVLDDELLTDQPFADQLRVAGDEALVQWRTTDLAQERVLPWATLPAGGVLGMYVMEIATHAWDLATATGQPNEFDPAVGEAVLAAATEFVPAADELRVPPMPFAPVQAAPAGAGPYTRLAAYLGRRA